MGRSAERRRAVRLAALLADLGECLRAERVAEEEGRLRPPLQSTGARARYVTLRPPRPRPPPGADEAAGGAGGASGVAAGSGSAEDALVAAMPRGKEPRVGPAFQATRLPEYRPQHRRAGPSGESPDGAAPSGRGGASSATPGEGEGDTPSPSAATAAPPSHPGVDAATALRPPYATPAAKTDAFAAALAALTDARVTGEAAVGLQWSLCAAFLRDFPRNEDDEAEGPPGFVPPHVVAEAELKQIAKSYGAALKASAPRSEAAAESRCCALLTLPAFFAACRRAAPRSQLPVHTLEALALRPWPAAVAPALLAALIEAPPPPHDTDCSGSLRQRVADAARAEGGRHALRAARLAAAMAARSEACAVSAGKAPGGDDVAAWAGCAWTAVCGLAAGCRAAATADAAAAVTRDVACAPRAAAALRDAARGAARRPDGKAATAAAAVALLAAGTCDDVAVLAAMRLGRSSTTQAAALAASLAACGAAPAARRALGAALDGGAAGSRRREAHACAQALFWAAPQQAAQALIATLPPPGAHPRAVAARAAVLEALATAAEAPCAAEAAASASAALAPSATSLLAAAAATQRQCDAARLAGALARLAAAHDDARAALRSAAVATLAASDASPCAVAAAATALYVSSSSDGGDAEDDAAALAATLAEEAGGCGSEGDDAQIVAARRGASYDTVAAALAHGSGAPPALRAALADAVVRHVASRYAAAGAAGGARLAFRFDAAFASGTAVPDGGKERQQPRCSDAFGPLTAALLRCAAPAGGNDARAKVLLAAMHAQCASACAVADTLGLPCAEAAQAADAAEAMTSSDAPDAGSPTAADAAAIAAVLALARPGSAAGGARPPWRALLSHGLAPALEAMAGALLAEPAAAASAATVLGCVGTARRGAPAAVAAASCAGVRLMSLHSALLELHGNAAAVLAAGGPACLPLPAALALLRAASACGDDVTAAAAAAASAWPLAARASCLSAAPSYQEAATWCAIAHNLVKAAEEDGSWENSTGDSGIGDDTSSYDVLPAPCALANGQACRCRGAAASAVMTSAKQPCLLQTAAASAMALFLSAAPPLGERAANSLKRQFAAPQGGKGRSKVTAGGGHASEVVVSPPPAVAAAPQGASRRATRGGAAVAAAPEAGMTAASPAARALRVAAAACGLLAPDEPASAADKLRMGTLALLASAAAAAARRSEAQLFRGGRMEKDALSRLCSRCVPEPLARAAAYGALPATHPSIGSGLHGSLMAALSDVPITAAALCFAVLMAPPDALNTGHDDVAVREYVELLAVLLASAPGRGEAACVGTATAGPAHVVARLLSRGLARGGPATAQEQAALLPLLLGDADTRGLLAPPSLELTTGAASSKGAGGSTPGVSPPDRDEHPAEATWLTLGAEALAAVEATARGVTSFTCLGTCPPADVLLFGGPARVQATALAATVAHVTEQLRRFSTQHGPRAAAHAPGALEWAHCVAATSRAVLDALDAAPAQGNDAHADADDAPPEVVAAAALYTPLMAKTLADAAAACMQAAAGMLQALPPHGADDDDVERDEPPEAAAARVAAAAAAAVAVARERATPPGGDVSPQPPGSPPLPSRSGAATPVLAPLREAAASKPVEDRHALLVQGAALHALGRRLAAHAERAQRKELRAAEDALVAAARAWAATARPPRPLPQHLRAVMRLAGRSGDGAAESPPEQPRAAKAKRRSSGKVKTQAAGRAQPAQAAPEPEERGTGRKRRRGHGYLDAAAEVGDDGDDLADWIVSKPGRDYAQVFKKGNHLRRVRGGAAARAPHAEEEGDDDDDEEEMDE